MHNLLLDTEFSSGVDLVTIGDIDVPRLTVLPSRSLLGFPPPIRNSVPEGPGNGVPDSNGERASDELNPTGVVLLSAEPTGNGAISEVGKADAIVIDSDVAVEVNSDDVEVNCVDDENSV